MRAMELLKSWLDAERGRAIGLARHLDVVPSFVHKIASGDKPIPVEHGAGIELYTRGAITRRAMFPNDWERIWPELAAYEAAQPVKAEEVGHA
jgi:DNA-binding transcriptional regulator YdaS (Cro superfamily)